MSATPPVITSAELLQALESLAPGDFIALDTEFMRESTYFPKLCLIQAANSGACAVLDPLTLPDLAPLWQFLADRRRTKVLHAARQAQGRITIPKRFSLGVREMFAAQPRLEQPRGRRALRMLEQPRFRAGFDLLLLRADMGLASRELADWWTKVQEVSQTDRDRMADALAPPRAGGEGGGGRRGPRRRRRGRGRAPAAS